MNQVITDNSSERITIIINPNNLAIKTEFKGELPKAFNNYRVTVLSKEEVKRLIPIAQKWLRV